MKTAMLTDAKAFPSASAVWVAPPFDCVGVSFIRGWAKKRETY